MIHLDAFLSQEINNNKTLMENFYQYNTRWRNNIMRHERIF